MKPHVIQTPQNVLNALEALLTDEIGGKTRLSRELARQERALISGTPDEVDEATRAIEVEVGRELERARRRDVIFGRLAAHWNVAASALTLSSIVERAGDAGRRIDELRGELRGLVADVLRRNRRVARLVAVNNEVMDETIAAVLGTTKGNQEVGVIFDARL